MKHNELIELLHEHPQGLDMHAICDTLGMSEATFYRCLQKARQAGAHIPKPEHKLYTLLFKPDLQASNLLSKKEKTAIQLAFQTLEKYRKHGAFKETDGLIQKLNTLLQIQIESPLNPIIQIESQHNKGIEHLEFLISLIQKQKPVRFLYKKHGNPLEQEKKVWPILLKEYKQIWYLYAQDLDQDYALKVYGLDRIKQPSALRLRIDPKRKIQQLSFPPSMYGLFPAPTENVQHIELEISRFARDFILAHPLHASQKVLSVQGKNALISLEITPNNEFYADILRFIPDVKVRSPKLIKNKIKELVKSIL